MKIVVAEKIAAQGIAALKTAGFEVVQLTPTAVSSGELAQALADAQGLIVRSAVKVNAAMIAAAPQLKVIGRAGVGVDNIDVPAASARKIVVMNAPGGSSIAVAELAMAMMLALARQLPRADATTRAGQWEKKTLEGTELFGKTLGLLGFGRIATEVAKRAHAFGMKVVAYDPVANLETAKELGVEVASFEGLLQESDYLSLHLSLTPGTRNILNQAAFDQMKPGIRIVNCARGEALDEAALAAALASGKVAGAALDVYTKEPPGASPLFQHPNVIATPHIGASTQEAQLRVGQAIAEQVRDYLQGGKPANAVNA